METVKQAYERIEKLKDGEHCHFNMLEGGGAVCYKCNGMYLLFSILHGVTQRYEGTYFENQLNDLVNCAFSWT